MRDLRAETKKYLASTELERHIVSILPTDKAAVALNIREYLLESRLSEFGVPRMKGTSALDMGFYMLFADVFDDHSKSTVLGEVCGVGKLCAKKWVDRLRLECMATVDWDRPTKSVRGNIGKFVVKHWGIYDYSVYAVFKPYAKMVLDNYLSVRNGEIE